MTEQQDSPVKDWRHTVFLPKTDFPMKAGLPAKEPGILAKWQAADQYRTLRNRRKGREKFILHDGPPYANGDMHIGHALNHILKDMVVRTQTLLGKDAPYVPGWDCHGLPIEWKVEEQYRKKKLNKDEVDPVEFRAECRAYAQNWVDIQREQLKRLGIGGDWDNPYLTMDAAAEGTIVAELMKFAESGQLYRGAKPVMWSPVEKTALAEAEVEYEDITSTQIDVAFEIVSSPIPELVGAYAVIWTTTPWTIPVNQAIAYGADVEYVLLMGSRYDRRDKDQPHSPGNVERIWYGSVLVAENLVDEFRARSVFQADSSPVKWRGKGSDLAGTMARHPMAKLFEISSPLAGEERDLARNELSRSGEGALLSAADAAGPSPDPAGHPLPQGERDFDPSSPLAEFYLRARPFLDGSSFVTTEQGTGLVHMAPDHGEDDFDLCKANGIEPVFAVEGDGKYRADWAWLGGQGSVINPKFNAPDGPICSDLRDAGGLIAASADYKHSYPHSWRSKAKVIYRCTPQWFVPMDKALENRPCHAELVSASMPQSLTSETNEAWTLKQVQGDSVGGKTLRETALAAIAATRFIPEKGRNRINSMVEGRPDWVLSRQRAWGVPITLFVNRKTGQYLCDPAVNARIIAAVRADGVDAWSDERAADYLGADYDIADYERVVDILDVWFDSGCTHAFVLESGKWPDLMRPADHIGPWADLYLEGTDQHRGWFQSSLLESCGTRGHAPYKAVLTHGFTMDAKGMKMSKSLGNTISPTDLMRDSGADILRLWALSVDFTEDHRIGKEILAGVSDQYRKLRNTFRYLLGALDGFSDAEKVDVANMPELERYMLHLLADMDAKLRVAVDDFDFNTYVRLLTDFANNDLSAFFFDIRKDSLYCDAATSPKRRAYRTVLDILFHALVRYAAPVLVFTAEEVWQTRYPDETESVHFLDWPVLPASVSAEPSASAHPELDEGSVGTSQQGFDKLSLSGDDRLLEKWTRLRFYRSDVLNAIERLRRDKIIGSSLEAGVTLSIGDPAVLAEIESVPFIELCIIGEYLVRRETLNASGEWALPPENLIFGIGAVGETSHKKCGRCWRHLPEVSEDGSLCGRCEEVVNA